jgi:hypothetical protein
VSETRQDLRWALVLVLLAFVHRAAFLFSNQDASWGFSLFYEGDAEVFFQYARALLDGRPFDGGVPFHPPGFPVFLALVYTLLGAGEATSAVPHTAVRLAMAAIGSVSVGLTFLLVRPYLGRATAAAGAALSVVAFALYVIHVSPVSEVLFQAVLLLTLLAFTRGLRHPLSAPGAAPRHPRWMGLVTGVLLGALALVRAEGIFLTAVVLAVGGVAALRPGHEVDPTPRSSKRRHTPAARGPEGTSGRRGRIARLVPWLLVVAGVLVVIGPWTIRNAIRLAEINRQLGPRLAEPLPTFVPLTIYGPLNLALANHPGADGTFSRVLLADRTGSGDLDLKDPEHLAMFLHGDRMAWAFIRADPKAFLGLVVRRWGLSFSVLEHGFTQWNVPAGVAGVRNPVDMMVPHGVGAMWVTLPLLVVGATLAVRRRGGERRLVGLVGLVTLQLLAATALFFGYARLAAIYLPLWLALGGVALAALGRELVDRWPGLGRAARPRTALIVAGVLLVVALVGARGERRFDTFGTPLPGQERLNPNLPVRIEPATSGDQRSGPGSGTSGSGP